MDSLLFVLLSLVVISGAFAGANFLAWRLFEQPPHALMWCIAYLLVSVQYTLNLVRDYLPNSETYWISANIVCFALVIFAVWGHRHRLGLATPRLTMLVIFGALTLTCIGVIVIWPVVSLRVALAPALTFLAMTHIAVILIRFGREPRLAQVVAALVHFLFGLTQGLAAAIALNFGNDPAPELVNAYTMVNFALMPSFFVAMGISVIFLLATDLSSRLRVLALSDQLTGVANRRGFIEASVRLLAQCRRRRKCLTLILVDIDFFKRVNDRYGHGIGDRALQHFAALLQQSVRAGDVVGRVGGEEFALTLGEMDCIESEAVAVRIQQALEVQPLRVGRIEIHLKASFGIAQMREAEDVLQLMQRADGALYEAKAVGRNAIIIAGSAGLADEASNGQAVVAVAS